jgi:large subunit ribosomal protein L24e
MAASRDKQRAHRKKTLEATKSSVKLREPISTEAPKEKIKVAIKAKSALLPGEGRSMGMELD